MLLTPAKITRTDRNWRYIVLHHSYSPDNKITSDWEGIRNYHIKTLGWSDIGYHYGIEYISGTPVIRFGRSLEQSGAHTIGFNDKGIGICIIGNFDAQIPTVCQYDAVKELCAELIKLYDITAKHIIGHRESYDLLGLNKAKTCPGTLFNINSIREHFLNNGFQK